MKRIFTLITATATIFASAVPTYASTVTFSDLDHVPWTGAVDIIKRVAGYGLVSGYADGTFKAFNNITYAETMQMIYTLLLVTGSADDLPTSATEQYASYMEALQIPSWAQRATIYALHTNIITVSELGKFMSGSTHNNATREDVTTYFAKAFSGKYGISGTTSEVSKFNDFNNITESNKVYIDTMVKLGIISGDHEGNFLPKDLINRAEMSVILDRSYNILKEGLVQTGSIENISQMGEIYFIQIKGSDGKNVSCSANLTSATITAGSDNTPYSLSRLKIGDEVEFKVSSDGLLETLHVSLATNIVTQLNTVGYIDKVTDRVIKITNTNTELEELYTVPTSAQVFVNGERVTFDEFVSQFNTSSQPYAFAGLVLSSNNVTMSDTSGNIYLEQEINLSELHVELTDNYTRRGKVTSLNSTTLEFTTLSNTESHKYTLTSDVDYYVDGLRLDFDSFQTLVNNGTTYITTTETNNRTLKRIDATNIPFTSTSNISDKVYTLKNITNTQLLVNAGGQTYVHYMGSSDTESIDYYWWEKDSNGNYGWSSKNVSSLVSTKNNIWDEDEDTKIYIKVTYNNAGKISKIEMSDISYAWTADTSYGNSEGRSGIVESSENGILKFEDVNTEYKLLNTYNVTYSETSNSTHVVGDDPNNLGQLVRNPLSILGAQTSSLVVFNRMASSKDAVLYAEIIADSTNNIQQIDSRLIEVTGLLRYCDLSEEKITIQLDNGDTLYLTVKPRVEVCDIIGDRSKLEDSTYLGSRIFAEFDEYGEIKYITLATETGFVTGNRVSGEAVSTNDGFKLVKTGKEYLWGSRSNVFVKNLSTSTTTTYGLDRLLSDPDVTMHLDVTLQTDNLNVAAEVIASAMYAEGVYENYDRGTRLIKVKTYSGETFAFYVDNNAEIDIHGLDTSSDVLNRFAVGSDIELTFTNGEVTRILSK